MMQHLFNSVVRVERLVLTPRPGMAPIMTWAQATSEDTAENDMLQYLRCRLDLTFIRPGRDIIPAPDAGRAPDHIGVMFTVPYAPLKAGDRIVAIPNESGLIPVPGTYEIRVTPDYAQDFSTQHHIEVQILEVMQELTDENWPDEEPEDDEDLEEPEP